jgi:arylsulfatase A
MKLIRWTKSVVVVIATLACAAGVANADERPNVVLIMADDMGYECLGANGDTIYKTPNLDRLAEQSVRFTRPHSTPICTPTRVQIMSGLYNSRNYTRFGHMAKDVKTFGNFFQDAGYATCVVGKWQLDGGYGGPKNFGFEGPAHYGFDEYCLWQLTRTSKNKPNRFANPGLEINGEEKNFNDGDYGPDILSDYANDFIKRQAEADKPFLLYYPMLLPHWPFEPTPESDDWDPDYRKNDATEKLKRPHELTSLPHFVDMVAYTDKIVGKILQQLEDAGVRDNTLVIFTGDNGTHFQLTTPFNGKPYPGGKGKTTLNGTHVPLIVDWPGQAKAGAVCDDLIDFTDMLPTMLDAASIPLPDGFQPDGRSFLPQVKGEAGSPREWIYCYYAQGKTEYAMTKRYKLYGNGKLFDLEDDFYEKSPIKPEDRTPQQRAVAEKLRAVIEAHTR